MHSPEELQAIFEHKLADEKIIKHPQSLYDPVNYILSLGGKRLRPVMLLMSIEAFGGDLEEAMPAALGIEMFHNFSLVHDDIMDKAPMRRGNSTVHEKWDANAAILSGDTMLVLAYEYFLRLDPGLVIPVIKIFGQTAKEVCEGQQYDLNFVTEKSVSLEDYLEMIRLKTAVLIGASYEIGSIIGGADSQSTGLIRDFGIYSGMAFQLMDDLLDVYGDEKEFGKRLYGDIRTNKKTFLYLKALELADRNGKETLQRYYAGGYSNMEDKVKNVVSLFNMLKIKEHTEKQIRFYHDKAIQCFSEVNARNDNKKMILEFTEQLMERKY